MGKTYIFNPDSDMALANGDANYLSPRSARRMAIDLAMLPTWYAHKGDAVLIPDSDQLYYWSKTLLNTPFCFDIKWITDKEKIDNQPLSPWGWNAAFVKQMRLRGVTDEHLPTSEKIEELRHLSSRKTAVGILAKVMGKLASEHFLIGKSRLCTQVCEVAEEIEKYAETMLKAPWSCSGKGLRRANGEYQPPLSGWCERILNQQGALVVEPLYNKIQDFAMEFYSQGNGESLDFVGYSYFVTDANGAYEGNLLLADEEIERELAKYIPTSTLHAVCDMLRHSIGEVINSNYCGYVGVDMMICQIVSESGEKVYRLHPCVEINLRMNMGVVAHTLRERYVAKGCTGKFMVEYYLTPIALKEAHEQKMNLYPLETDSDGCITRGYLPLTPIGRETQYIGWIMIE